MSNSARPPGPGRASGFTLVELVMALSIAGVLSAIVVPTIRRYLDQARVAEAIGDIAAIQSDLQSYDPLPETLSEIGKGNLLDPWGRAYRYLRIDKGSIGKARKDKFLVPLNSDYDLYSIGKDGLSNAPLSSSESRDDIVRANDGAFIGLASRY